MIVHLLLDVGGEVLCKITDPETFFIEMNQNRFVEVIMLTDERSDNEFPTVINTDHVLRYWL